MESVFEKLGELGQSLWWDSISRSLLESGELKQRVEQDGLAGLTSNPAIFEKAMGDTPDYDDKIRSLIQAKDRDVKALFDELAIVDIQAAADILAPVYQKTATADGYVSLEVSPYLALDTDATVTEARYLWERVQRPNLMVKVPGTEPGLPAIRQLISDGINVNITLLFSKERYAEVLNAYLEGLEARIAQGKNVDKISSVASFFVSRIDSVVDKKLEDVAQKARPEARESYKRLEGKVAIANAKLAYLHFQEVTKSARWQKLKAAGAKPQRLLWASTSTKNPAYRDVMYVEELIGPETVNTLPPATFYAFKDHGIAKTTLTEKIEDARQVLISLEKAGVSLKEITDGLLTDAITLFSDPFDKLMTGLEKKRRREVAGGLNAQTVTLPLVLSSEVGKKIEEWRREGKVRRLWEREASLWTGKDESHWLGWLDIVSKQAARVNDFQAIFDEVRAAGLTQVALLGMGGSSLCVEVFAKSFSRLSGASLHVLDSTDPAQILSFERALKLEKTLFIVASKSGSTLEPNLFHEYFFAKVSHLVGAQAGKHFIAITDPGSQLEKVAKQQGFLRVFSGVPSIGGRYSALSDFGLIPAAISGVDCKEFLGKAEAMVHACGKNVPPETNPGVTLGLVLGTLGKAGCDKLTVIASPEIAALGSWIEQLVAESTGKQGKGLIPIVDESLGEPKVYGKDRVFVYLKSGGRSDLDGKVAALIEAEFPVVTITLGGPYHLGQEFFRWEIATAAAGAVMGINPFDQPDVEFSKIETKKLTTEFEQKGQLPKETPFWSGEGVSVFAPAAEVSTYVKADSLTAILKVLVQKIKAGDYFAELAYLERNDTNRNELQAIRHAVRDATRAATAVGFGPRFLHSTGQAYKGGPNSGVFLQLTTEPATDVSLPTRKLSFAVVEAAQARGDFEVLAARKRRALRVHFTNGVSAGLKTLRAAFTAALD